MLYADPLLKIIAARGCDITGRTVSGLRAHHHKSDDARELYFTGPELESQGIEAEGLVRTYYTGEEVKAELLVQY